MAISVALGEPAIIATDHQRLGIEGRGAVQDLVVVDLEDRLEIVDSSLTDRCLGGQGATTVLSRIVS